MPKLTPAEIEARVADGSIKAITIDTSIFDRYGCNLDFAVFRKLDQFAGGAVRILISEIVAEEINKHISEEAAETQRALKKALSSHGKRWKIAASMIAPAAEYRISDDPALAALEQIDDFIAAIGAEVVPALGINDRTPEILQRYFAVEPPFEHKEAKKNEFPDAFALLSLEAHARREGGLILCVTADKGWARFCETSAHLVHEAELDRALSHFNITGRVVAERAAALLRAGATEPLVHAIESALESRFDFVDFEAEGWSSVSFESEPLGAALQSVDWESASPPVVIAADKDQVTFTVQLSASVSFEASFHFEVRDGIDRDYISLGSETFENDATVEFEIVVTVPRELEERLDEIEAEVARRRIEIDFGSVEPFQNEDPTHEKY